MNNFIKSGKLFLFLGSGLFFIDSIIVMAGLGLSPYWLIHGIVAMVLAIAMLVIACFSKKHIAFDIVFMVLACIAFFVIARVATNFEKSELRPIALTCGILCYVEGACSVVGGVLAILYIKNGYAASESSSYRSRGGFAQFLRNVGSAIGRFFAAIGELFTRKKRSSYNYGRGYSRRSNKLKELLESKLFRTLFSVFLAVGSIIYCAVSLYLHFVWLDILTGIPIALALATVGNVLLTLKNEYLSDVDEDEKISKNILAILLIFLYHVLFVLATLTSFLVFNHYSGSGEPSPFVAALNISFGVIAIAQPFIYDRLEDNDKEWLTVFGFIFFYAALYLANIGICCLETYAMNSKDMIVSRIVAGVVSGATLVFGIIRIIICIKNIALRIADKMTPQSVKEQRQMELDFKQREREEHPQFFKCAQKLSAAINNTARELIKTSVDVSVSTNELESYGSDYNELKINIIATITRHLPLNLSSSQKHEIKKKYHKMLFENIKTLIPNIKAETGYKGKVSFELTVN